MSTGNLTVYHLSLALETLMEVSENFDLPFSREREEALRRKIEKVTLGIHHHLYPVLEQDSEVDPLEVLRSSNYFIN
jgi:hypothetical protein